MSVKHIHLNVHSEYSLMDSTLHIKSMVGRAKALNMPAIALTDVMNFYAVIKFYKAAMAAGIKPIIGCSILVAPQTQGKPHYLNLLCMTHQGYQQVVELVSRAYLEADRIDGIPMIPRTWLQPKQLTDVIALCGGYQGDITEALTVQQDADLAQQRLQYWCSVFPDRFYLELQRIGQHNEEAANQHLLQLACRHHVPLVATQAVRFESPDDFTAHEVRVAIHDGFTLEDPKRPKHYSENQYLMSPDEMAERYADVPEALVNTIRIAQRCNVIFELGRTCLPDFPIPEGMTTESYFRQVSHKGLQERLLVLAKQYDQSIEALTQTYSERLDIELNVIINMGFSGYFLIVADFIQWAKDQGIPVGPGRGSGAGSLVAYALGITDIDPIPYDLLFERFLNPERVSMPDFDIDFCMDGRDRVIDYVAQKYGRESVSQIITFGSMAAKAVVRDVGRVLGHPYGFVDSIAKLIPMDLGMTLPKALNDEPQLCDRYEQDDEVRELLDMALKLEGTVRNVGKHAGGVVIAPSKLTDFSAVYCEAGTQTLVSQFDKDDVETAGLVKFDFLGLRNLTIIDNAVRIINQQRLSEGEAPLVINEIALDDKPTYDLLKRHQTTAVFQLESRGMKDLIRRLQPDCFEDIIALVALFRPGPLQSGMVDDFIDRKHGRAKVAYPHDSIGPTLAPTYGIILYQEQVMKIAQVMAKYSLGGADLLRRAMGKKKPQEMAKQRKIFLKGALNNHIDKDTATYVFDLMEKFAGYGFNKSHSAAYAYVAYQTAYLKAHYPAAFMAAVLSSDMDNTDKVVSFIEDCYEIGIQVLAPDINQSQYRFTTAGDTAVRYGLGAVKGVGESAIEIIVNERAVGQYSDLFEFCRRVDVRKVNRRVIEALIYAGAFDDLAPNRATLIASVDKALQMAEQHETNTANGQDDLFGGMLAPCASHSHEEICPQVKPMPAQARLLQEKQVLGFFLSGHPMADYQDELKALGITPLAKLKPTGRGQTLWVAGMVINTRRIKTRSGRMMQILTIDDGKARSDVTIFSEQAEQYRHLLKSDSLLVIEGEVSHDEFSGGWRIVAKQIDDMQSARTRACTALHIRLAPSVNLQSLAHLKQALLDHQGNLPVSVSYCNATSCAALKLEVKVAPTDALLNLLSTWGDAQLLYH
jgi:DNA polymerase-3 subunit alpha